MSEGIRPGLVGEKRVVVTEKDIAPQVPVFSTPALVLLFEEASSAAIREHRPPGTADVGFEVNIRHLGPAPVGGEVRARAEVTEVRGNKVYFKLIAHYGDVKIGDGTHSRALVPSAFRAK